MVILLFLAMIPVAFFLAAAGWHAWAEPPGSPLFAGVYWLLATLALLVPVIVAVTRNNKETDR